jgi:hypothetical protein
MGEDNPPFACEGSGGTFVIRWNWNNRLLLGEPFAAGSNWLRPLPDDNQDRETGREFTGRKRASRKKRQSRKMETLSTSCGFRSLNSADNRDHSQNYRSDKKIFIGNSRINKGSDGKKYFI